METEKRLRKDLKRTKVLLADAQIMLDHLKSNAPSKREIAQLKNQVCHFIKYITLSWNMMPGASFTANSTLCLKEPLEMLTG